MNKIYNNKMYFLLSSILCLFITLLNASNKLVICSFILVLLTFTTNIISELYGKRKTIQSIISAILIATILSWNIKFYVHGAQINIILASSFAAVLLSTYFSTYIILTLKTAYSFHIKNFLGLLLASVIDSTITSIMLLTKFSANKVLAIFMKDIAFKFAYSVTISLCLFAILYTLRLYKNAPQK